MDDFKLKAKSSKGDYYTVTFEIGDKIRVGCDCNAGVFGKLCKHKLGFLEGDKNFLYDINDNVKLDELFKVVKRSEYPKIQNNVTSAQANVEEARKRLNKIKGKLEKALKEGIKITNWDLIELIIKFWSPYLDLKLLILNHLNYQSIYSILWKSKFEVDKANKLGIKVISENEFKKKVDEAELKWWEH